MEQINKHRADVNISLTFEAFIIAVAIVIAGNMISTSMGKQFACNCPVHGHNSATGAKEE